ncbi:hypothetical protein LTR73_005231 [Friedmanniomyces endolithicus]|nr:hypothetical protein LTR73_005231 [Friedmanniomyces endolithicus]
MGVDRPAVVGRCRVLVNDRRPVARATTLVSITTTQIFRGGLPPSDDPILHHQPAGTSQEHLAMMLSNVSPPADKPTLMTIPQEVKNIIYSLLLPSGEVLKRIKPFECAKTAAWNAFAVICVDATRLDTAILRVNKAMNTEATDVLFSCNNVMLDVEECCSRHGVATVREHSRRQFIIKQPYRKIQLQFGGSSRRGCDRACIVKLVKSIAAVLKDSGRHKLTVDLSGVSTERIIGVHFLLASEPTGTQYTEVGTAQTTLSSVTTRFVHPPIRQAFSIMSGLPRSLLTLPMRRGHPEALWHISETHPWVLRSLVAMLRLYYEDEENSELLSEVWAENEPSEEELATVTHWGFVGGVLEDGQD